MSAAELRQAAETLRGRATAATQGPWRWDQYRDDLPFLVGHGGNPDTYEWEQEVIEAEHHGECGCRSACHLELTVKREDRDYITTLHPGVGLALADWLEYVWRIGEPGRANGLSGEPYDYAQALEVARLINGGAE